MAIAAVEDVKDPHDEQEVEHGRRVITRSFLVVALRCTLQYIVLPFVLPFLGVSGRLSIWLSAALEIFALGLMAFNVRRLWHTSWRWRYIGLSVLTGSIILIMLTIDVLMLLGRYPG